MSQIPPRANDDYRARRMALHEAEVALREQRERVAAMRRDLPRDTPVEDYLLEELEGGAARSVRLSELFSDGEKPLVLMHFMYGKAQEFPCPMCTMWADGYVGAIRHLARRVDFAILVAGDLPGFMAHAERRDWRDVRVLSAGASSLKRDLGFESDEGGQMPGVSIFERDASGALTHFYSVCAFGPDGGRMMDLLSPVWNFFDLTPEGRGEFMPSVRYPES